MSICIQRMQPAVCVFGRGDPRRLRDGRHCGGSARRSGSPFDPNGMNFVPLPHRDQPIRLGCRGSGRGPPMVSGERRTAHGGADALVLSGRVFDLGAIENIARNGCLIKGRTPFTELRFGRAVTAAGARLQGSADFAFTGGTIFVSFPPCCSYVCAPTVPATLNPFFVRMSAA